MDKRTLFFVISLSLTLFLVNVYFESQKTDEMRQWNQQQSAKKEEQVKKWSADVAKRTAPAKALPLVILYADQEGKEKVGVGIQSSEAVLTIAWSQHLPKVVYKQTLNSSQKPAKLLLSNQDVEIGKPVIYQEGGKGLLNIGELPEFGFFELQVVIPSYKNEQPSYEIFLADYKDGSLTFPALNLLNLKQQLDPEADVSESTLGNGLVLAKFGDKYVPVAIYASEQKVLEPLDALSTISQLVFEQDEKIKGDYKAKEKFYVLETPYQQLVFSSYGGALAEINLPFQSPTDEESVVKEIQFDRDMVNKHPYNARFPAHPYYTFNPKENGEMKEHLQGTLGGYHPLLRRDLIQEDKRKSIKIKPRYYALNIISEYPETAELVYEVKKFTKDSIVFEANQGHRRITKTFSVSNEVEAPYAIDLVVNIQGETKGLWLTSGIPEVEWISGAPAPALKFRMTRNQKAEVENIDLPKDSITVTSTYLDWICNSNGFFGMIMDSLVENDPGYRAQVVSGSVVPSRLVEIDQDYDRFNADNLPGYMMMLPLKSSGGEIHYRVFAGPFSTKILKQVDQTYSNPTTGYNPDYLACQSFHGWFAFISEPFAKFLFVLMNFFHFLTGSWAFSIILLTVALRVMLYPLNAWSAKSMIRMQQISPEVTAIQERNKKDPKKAQLEIMNLYRERGVNPVSGCFPLLIQMPFLIGMFDLLKSTFELRGASFIPGWIDDLTAPDVLFSWQTPLPFIGNQFHLLPILLGLVMFAQQRLMSTMPKDPALLTEQQRQQKFMGNIMSVVFMVMFYNFPSGLNIYWLSSMLLGMLQQYITMKKMKPIVVPTVSAVAPLGVKGKKK